MNYMFIIALVLSLIWHSFAFILFKLAEPYNIKPEINEMINVDLILPEQSADTTLDSLRKIDFLDSSRFSLPSESGQMMPSPEINADLQKKMSYLKTQPIYEKSLIKHRPVIDRKIKKTDFLADLNRNIVDSHYPIKKSADNTLLNDDKDKTVLFLLRGTERKLVEHFLPENNLLLSRPLVVKFSIDTMGSVKNVIIEKSSGSNYTDKLILKSFKKWKFEKSMVLKEFDMRNTPVQWGNAVFYIN